MKAIDEVWEKLIDEYYHDDELEISDGGDFFTIYKHEFEKAVKELMEMRWENIIKQIDDNIRMNEINLKRDIDNSGSKRAISELNWVKTILNAEVD